MNIENLKAGFQSYLEELGENSGKNYTVTNSDISIFMYAKEFKDYISDELNVSSDVLSMNVRDILKMEVVNGKLVDTSKQDASVDTEAQQTGDIPDDSNGSTEGNEIIFTEDGSNENLLSDILNEFIQMDEVKSLFDLDKDGELNEQEITTLLYSIKNLDGNSDDITIDDITAAAEAIQKYTESKAAETTPAVSGTSGASGGGYSSGGSSGVSSSGSSNASTQEKTLDNMNLDELNSELSTAQSDLSDKKSVLEDAVSGNLPELQELKEGEDEAYQAYRDALLYAETDRRTLLEISRFEEEIEAKEQEINDKEIEISDQECVVSSAEAAYNSAVDSQKEFQSMIIVLEGTKTNENSSKVEEKINNLQTAINELKVDEKKQAWDDAEIDLQNMKNEKKDLEEGEGGLNELKERLKTFEDTNVPGMSDENSDVYKAREAYNTAKQEYKDAQNKAISEAKTDITDAQNYVNDVQSAISNYETNKVIKENSMDLQAAIDWARQFDDLSESEIKSVFAELGYQFDPGKWCADFVRMVLGEAIGDENLPEWYQSCPHQAFRPTIQTFGEGHQVSAEDAKAGDIVLYDWNGDGFADHVGLFVDNGDGSSTITAIEGNTSGAGGSSCVEEKSRDRSSILGIYSMS